jgi:hypothetical protein
MTKSIGNQTYQHTQRATVILYAMIGLGLVFFVVGATVLWPALITAPLLFVTAWRFHSLTIEIADGELRWRFGPGWIRKQVSLDLILSAEPVRTNFIEGWGIHLSRFGWLYNASGYDAVAIRMKNGQHFALGTDEPAVLAAQFKRDDTGRGEKRS